MTTRVLVSSNTTVDERHYNQCVNASTLDHTACIVPQSLPCVTIIASSLKDSKSLHHQAKSQNSQIDGTSAFPSPECCEHPLSLCLPAASQEARGKLRLGALWKRLVRVLVVV